jgi:hypothetical protein
MLILGGARKMPESQLHGFTWENEVKRKVFNMDTSIGYTSIHDIPKEFNCMNCNENISIKTTGSGTLCMGDPLRIWDYSDDEIHTGMVLRYRQEGGVKRLVSTREITLNNRALLFGSVTREEIVALSDLIKSHPRDRRDPAIDAEIVRVQKELNAKSGIMQFNPKIQTKIQRRLQCSIPNYESAEGLITATADGPVVRGVPITEVIDSTPRARNRRV